MSKKILLLEDDEVLSLTLLELLRENGYDVDLASNGGEAADISYSNRYDLYIFDVNVPDINGFNLLSSLRGADDNTPAIFITALSDINSIAKGFSVGADDYIKKPFFPQELLIRVDVKLKRSNATIISYKNIEYNQNSNIIKKDGKIIVLGEVQERLFKVFIENIGVILDKEVLFSCLEQPSPTALRVAITKLKQTTGLQIINLRSIGYMLEKS